MTRIFGVIGCPIEHSLSPAMHTAALEALHLDAIYAPFEVHKQFLCAMLRGLILSGVEGLNVTVPLKEATLALMDRLDESARLAGAVNTIVIRNRRTIGYNTDGTGFRLALKELGWRRQKTRALILGAGGSARSVAWELARIPGSCVTITNRHMMRARRLACRLSRACPRSFVRAVSLNEISLEGVDLLVNATTVGMAADDALLINPKALNPGVLVYDLVYHRKTPLVQAALRRGCVARNGLSMLLYQGAQSLRLWLRRSPPIEVMRKALYRAIDGKDKLTLSYSCAKSGG